MLIFFFSFSKRTECKRGAVVQSFADRSAFGETLKAQAGLTSGGVGVLGGVGDK